MSAAERMSSKDIAASIVDADIYKVYWDRPQSEWPVSEQGLICPAYCNLRTVLGNVGVRGMLQEQLVMQVQERFEAEGAPDAIVGVVSAGMTWAGHVSDRLQLPMSYVRPAAKSHGQGGAIEGQLEPGMNVHVIDDVFLSGNTITKSSAFLAGEGVRVSGITALLRLSDEIGGVQDPDGAFRTLGVESLFHYADLVDVAIDREKMTENQGARLKFYYGNPTTQPWD